MRKGKKGNGSFPARVRFMIDCPKKPAKGGGTRGEEGNLREVRLLFRGEVGLRWGGWEVSWRGGLVGGGGGGDSGTGFTKKKSTAGLCRRLNIVSAKKKPNTILGENRQ